MIARIRLGCRRQICDTRFFRAGRHRIAFDINSSARARILISRSMYPSVSRLLLISASSLTKISSLEGHRSHENLKHPRTYSSRIRYRRARFEFSTSGPAFRYGDPYGAARADKDVSNPPRGSLKSLGKQPMLVLLYPISRLPRKQPSKRYLFPIATLGVVYPTVGRLPGKREHKEKVYGSKERFNLSKSKSRRG